MKNQGLGAGDAGRGVAGPLGSDLGAPGPVRDLAERLLPLYYEEVRTVARRERRRFGAGETLANPAWSPTATTSCAPRRWRCATP